MKENLMCYRVEIRSQVQNDTSFKRHSEFISGSNVFCHSEFISGSKILKRVQYDKRGRHPDTTSHRHPEVSPARHPEFISGSKILKRVQYDKSFFLFAKLWAHKIFAHTSPQFKKQFTLGRSMIEMLGVLAIIGVLSIGGLYAYKQAMMRYRLNQTQDWLSRMRFAIAVNCDDDDGTKCAFGDTGVGYDKRRDLLCADAGQDFCSNAYPYKKGITWLMYIPSSQSNYFTAYFYDIDKEYCESFVQRDWANLHSISKSSVDQFTLNRQPLTQAQKDSLKAQCSVNVALAIRFYRHD